VEASKSQDGKDSKGMPDKSEGVGYHIKVDFDSWVEILGRERFFNKEKRRDKGR